MKYQKVLDMATKFADLSNKTVHQFSTNIEFQAQRDMLEQFSSKLIREMKVAIGEMGNEINTLKERNFDSKMLELFIKVYYRLISIYKEIDKTKPYIAGEKFVEYVLERPNSYVINNLDFLAKLHLKQTNVDYKPSKVLTHPEIRSLDLIKKLATEARFFINEHPLVKPMIKSEPPVGLPRTMENVPAFPSGEDEETKA
jgi:hypothetical protein